MWVDDFRKSYKWGEVSWEMDGSRELEVGRGKMGVGGNESPSALADGLKEKARTKSPGPSYPP